MPPPTQQQTGSVIRAQVVGAIGKPALARKPTTAGATRTASSSTTAGATRTASSSTTTGPAPPPRLQAPQRNSGRSNVRAVVSSPSPAAPIVRYSLAASRAALLNAQSYDPDDEFGNDFNTDSSGTPPTPPRRASRSIVRDTQSGVPAGVPGSRTKSDVPWVPPLSRSGGTDGDGAPLVLTAPVPPPPLSASRVQMVVPSSVKKAKAEIPTDVQAFASQWQMAPRPIQTFAEYARSCAAVAHYPLLDYADGVAEDNKYDSAVLIDMFRQDETARIHEQRMLDDVQRAVPSVSLMYSRIRSPSRLFVRDYEGNGLATSTPVVAFPCRNIAFSNVPTADTTARSVIVIPVLCSPNGGVPIFAVTAPDGRAGTPIPIPSDTEGGSRSQCVLESMIPIAAIDALVNDANGTRRAPVGSNSADAQILPYDRYRNDNGVVLTPGISALVFVRGTMSYFQALTDAFSNIGMRTKFIRDVIAAIPDSNKTPLAVRTAVFARGPSGNEVPQTRLELGMTSRLLRAYPRVIFDLCPTSVGLTQAEMSSVASGTIRMPCEWRDVTGTCTDSLICVSLGDSRYQASTVLYPSS